MKKIYKLFIIIVLSLSSMTTVAQTDGITFSLLKQMPYPNYFNPGIRVPYGGLVGIGISNVNVAVYNSGLQYKNIYSTDANGEMYIDGVKFVNGLKEQDNCLNTSFSLDLLNIGFRAKKVFINIDWRVRMEEEFLYSKDFVGFFLLGNGNYLGQDNPADFNVGLEATLFSEIGVGVQVDINDHLTIGIRPKFIAGVLNARANNERTKIYTDANSYAISADVNLDMRVSSILSTPLNRIGDVTSLVNSFDFSSLSFKSISEMINIKNDMGFGIDLGASYVFNQHWGVALGLKDIGFIKWKTAKVKSNNVENLEINDGLFDDVQDVVKLNLDYNSMLDAIVKNVWGNDSLVDGADYVTYLNTRAMLQGYYELHPMFRITAFGQVQYVRGEFRPSATFAYSGSFFRFLNLTASYTLSKYAGNTLGAGIAFHFGPINLYAVTDNIMIVSKINKSTVEMATTYNNANVRLGLVFTIGQNKKFEKFPYTKKAKVEETDVDETNVEEIKVEEIKVEETKEEVIEKPVE